MLHQILSSYFWRKWRIVCIKKCTFQKTRPRYWVQEMKEEQELMLRIWKPDQFDRFIPIKFNSLSETNGHWCRHIHNRYIITLWNEEICERRVSSCNTTTRVQYAKSIYNHSNGRYPNAIECLGSFVLRGESWQFMDI